MTGRGRNVAKSTLQRARLEQVGIDAASSTTEQLAAFVKAEVAKWTQVVKIAGVKLRS